MSDEPPSLIYVSRNGQQFGPFTPQQVWNGVTTGHLFPNDLACAAGGDSWQPLAGMMNLPPAGAVQNIGQNVGMRMILPVGRSGWAIAAGYLGLFAFVILPAPLALLISIIAIVDIRKHRNDPNPRHGMGRAVFGLITGTLGTVVLVAFLVSRYL